jgi:preprotein translocase subunit YajC
MVIIVYFVVIALAFFLLIVLPQRRRATAHRALVESLGVDDEVVTIGGVFGTIRAVDNDRIELEVAPGVLITVARNAIAQAANPTPPESPDPSHDEHPADNGTGDD